MDIKPPRKPTQRPAMRQDMPTGTPRPLNPAASNAGIEGIEGRTQPRPVPAPGSMENTEAPNHEPKVPAPQPIEDREGLVENKKPRKRRTGLWILLGIVGLIVLAAVGAAVWYRNALSPVDAGSEEEQTVEIITGMTPADIAAQLGDDGLIRSDLAFNIHTRLEGTRGQLQAGTYTLSPGQSTPEIVEELVGGPSQDEFEVTFLPGARLANHQEVLIELGYDAAEVEAAFTRDYDHALLEHKPADASLEGYIYGETHRFAAGTSVEDILIRYFDEMYQVVFTEGVVQAYEEQGLSFHEGLILASIIQREVSGPEDSPIVAQIMYSRLDQGMPLGMDATFYYAAWEGGYTPSPEDDSPYNTRVHAGLPPGPIASPGYDALNAVAHPADTDYLYFVSGDDGINYFTRTQEEHDVNVREHCQVNCQIH